MTWIQTASGTAFDLVYPSSGDVQIDDIACALSRICRFNGHTRRHYSVAEHSLLVAACMPTPYMQKVALLHDAAEAYVGDMTAPLKIAIRGKYGQPSSYDAVTDGVEQAIASRFCLTLSDLRGEMIKKADLSVLALERDTFFPEPRPRAWLDLPDPPENLTVQCLAAEEAERRFLETWLSLESPRLAGRT